VISRDARGLDMTTTTAPARVGRRNTGRLLLRGKVAMAAVATAGFLGTTSLVVGCTTGTNTTTGGS
jgi:hypothetical protein